MSERTKCIYCGSTSFGKTCLFSPTKTHVHMGDPNKCIYCGSKYIGSGCLMNPYSKIHVRGPEFLNKIKEQTAQIVLLNYLMENLNNPLNNPDSPLGKFYTKIVSIIGEVSEPIIEMLNITNKPTYSGLQVDKISKAIEYKKTLTEQLNVINQIIFDANTELPKEVVEEIIVDTIISNNA